MGKYNCAIPLKTDEQSMPKLRYKVSLLILGLLVCNVMAPPPVTSEETQTIHGALMGARGRPWDKRELTAGDGEYLRGIKRIRRLYCNVGIGFHLQVLPNGKITGVHSENSYSKYFWFFITNLSFNCAFFKFVYLFYFFTLSFFKSIWMDRSLVFGSCVHFKYTL